MTIMIADRISRLGTETAFAVAAGAAEFALVGERRLRSDCAKKEKRTLLAFRVGCDGPSSCPRR